MNDILPPEEREAISRQTAVMAKLGAFVQDLTEDRCLYCSVEMAQLFGMTVDEYLDRCGTDAKLIEFIHPDDRGAFLTVADATRKRPGPYRMSYRQTDGRGRLLHVDEMGEIFIDDRGHVRIVGCVQDVTERKAREDQLRAANVALEQGAREAAEREALLRQGAHLARLGAFTWDLTADRLIWCSEELARLHGMTVDEYSRECATDALLQRFVHPDDRQRFQAVVAEARTHRKPYRLPYRQYDVRGQLQFVIEAAEILDNEADGHLRIVGCVIDVTEQKLVEEALRDANDTLESKVVARTAELQRALERAETAERLFATAAASLRDGLAIYDGEDRLAYRNERYLELLPEPLRAEMRVGGRWQDILDRALARGPVYHEDMGSDFERTRRDTRSGPDRDTELRFSDGRWIEISESPVPDGGFVVLLSDITARKLAEAEARAMRDRFVAAAEAMTDGLAILDCDDRFVFHNKRYPEHLAPSVRAALALGKRFDDCIREGHTNGPVYHADMGEDFLDRRLAMRTAAISDHDQHLSDGRWLRLRESHMADGGRVLLTSDITAWRAAENARLESEARLRASEELYRAIVEDQVDLVSRHDADGRVTFVNGVLGRLLAGDHPERVIGTDMYDGMEEPYREQIREQMQALTPDNPVAHGENPKTAVSGEVRWYTFTNRALFDADGKCTGYQCVGRDISDRRKVEEALRESEARLAAFLQNAPVGMYLKDVSERFVMANPEMAKVCGLPLDQILGRNSAEVFGAATGAMIKGYDREILEGRGPTAHEEHIPFLEHYAWSLVIRFPVIDAEGTITHIGGFDVDMTRQKRIEDEMRRQREALHQSEKMNAMGSLLAGVAHELNNPLSVVTGQAFMLEEQVGDGPIRARATRIRNAAERCARIVRTFLAMARHKGTARRSVDLNGVIHDALEIASYGLKASGIVVTMTLEEHLPPLAAEEDQLDQVVANLVINAQHALQAQPGNRQIAIASALDGSHVRLDVDDNGPGVPASIRSRVFDPFFTTKPMGVGTGIGLAVCHGIVTAHGGTIEVGTSPLGGARFTVRLPLEASKPVEAGATPNVPSHIRGAVLVVDDEPEIADTLAELFATLGLEVAVAGHGAAALELLKQRRFDLVLTDLRMPGLGGQDLHTACQNLPAPMPHFVFMTGDTLGADLSGILKETGAPLLEKPLDLAAVRRMVVERLSAGEAI